MSATPFASFELTAPTSMSTKRVIDLSGVTPAKKARVHPPNSVVLTCSEVNSESLVNVISIYAQKGGVGKTTDAFLLAYGMASLGKRVVLVDCDAQSSLTNLIIRTRENVAHCMSLFKLIDYDSSPFDRVTLYSVPTSDGFLGFVLGDSEMDDIKDNITVATSTIRNLLAAGVFNTDIVFVFYDRIQRIAQAANCDYVILDLSSAFDQFNQLALCTSKFVITPMNFSKSSVQTLDLLHDSMAFQLRDLERHVCLIRDIWVGKVTLSSKRANEFTTDEFWEHLYCLNAAMGYAAIAKLGGELTPPVVPELLGVILSNVTSEAHSMLPVIRKSARRLRSALRKKVYGEETKEDRDLNPILATVFHCESFSSLEDNIFETHDVIREATHLAEKVLARLALKA